MNTRQRIRETFKRRLADQQRERNVRASVAIASVSDCCNAPVKISGDDDGFGAATCCYVCTACGDACDTKPSS